MIQETIRRPNTQVLPQDIERHVLLIGGEHPPLVISIVNELTTQCQEIVNSRGFYTYRCRTLKGNIFTLGITGVGPAATEIAVNEYASCGASLFLRAGTSAALPNTLLQVGDIVIAQEAIRFDGVSDLYTTKKFRATATKEITQELVRTAKELGIEYKVGLTLTSGGYYVMNDASEGALTSFSNDVNPISKPIALVKLLKVFVSKRVLNIEMETATLLTLSKLFGLKAGAINGISSLSCDYGNEPRNNTEIALKNAIRVGISALDYLQS